MMAPARDVTTSADLRTRAARGVLITSAFMIGLQTLSLVKSFVIAAFLTKSEFGIWGILVVSLGTLSFLKDVGIADKFVQQDESDQRRAFHVAFTVEDIEGAYRRLSAAGIHFHAPPQLAPDGGAKVTYCRDPEGTIIELVQVLAPSR